MEARRNLSFAEAEGVIKNTLTPSPLKSKFLTKRVYGQYFRKISNKMQLQDTIFTANNVEFHPVKLFKLLNVQTRSPYWFIDYGWKHEVRENSISLFKEKYMSS